MYLPTIRNSITISRHGHTFVSISTCKLSSIATIIVTRQFIFTSFAIPDLVTTKFHINTFMSETSEFFWPATGPPIWTSRFVRTISAIDSSVASFVSWQAFTTFLTTKFIICYTAWTTCLI